jgi:hypothetical protein
MNTFEMQSDLENTN